MPLAAPNLDDRRFQDLVDDAKRLVAHRCPAWTDHNVSDPGVTLIETFAFMVDQLLYRLNRVPDRNYLKFLDLIGVHLFPPTAARADVTFWLSAPQPDAVTVAVGTQVATLRTETEEAVVFAVDTELAIVPCSLAHLGASLNPDEVIAHDEAVGAERPFACFNQVPQPGDALYVGLSEPVPGGAVMLRVDCDIEGVGVDPKHPPIAWEAFDGEEWVPAALERDETGGLNQDGDVVLHLPASHAASVINKHRAGWLRARVLEVEEGQPTYSASPVIRSLTAATIGGTTTAVHAEIVAGEHLGISEGTPGQTLALKRRPVVPSPEPVVVETSSPDGWEPWERVDGFARSGPADRHFVLDEADGLVIFGPAVREPDGSVRRLGAVPPKGTRVRVPEYRTGGGSAGNVARGAITVLKSSIPYVSRVENRRPAAGGVDGEDVASAKVRGPLLLRTRDRAVTAEDYEHLVRQCAPEIARVKALAAGEGGADAGSVRVLLVPAAADDESGALAFEQLVPSEETLARLVAYLDERRMIGARVLVEPPLYQGVTVVAKIRARPRTSATRLQEEARRALYAYLHPIHGGPDGTGWPFGRPLHVGEVYSVLQRLGGTEFVEDARLFGADVNSGQRGDAVQRLELPPDTLVFSYQHAVRVEG
ncbi:MAG: putative baseplate assembly protein [Acidimicrobiia bacterium]